MNANQKTVLKDVLRGAKPQDRLSVTLKARPARTRVAPSPTGFFHVGTARTALHNWLAARASGGDFLLRVDDTDHARNQDAFIDLIDQSLVSLGLDPDRRVIQSSRQRTHVSAALALLDAGLAWKDMDGSVRLALSAADALPSHFFDLTVGDVAISDTVKAQTNGLTLLRQDGAPTYPLASVVDDIDMGVNLILRGADHLSNTPKQLAIAMALSKIGWSGATAFCDDVVFAHVGLITKQGKKLSKRDGGSSLTDVLHDATAGAVNQWALKLGWSHPDANFDKAWPVLDLKSMVSLFGQGRLKNGNVDISADKLRSLARTWVARGG